MITTAEAYGLHFSVPARDQAVGASLRNHGEFARPEVDFLLACATAPSGSFVDVGANLGAIALPFAARRPAWRVLGIEPHPGLHDLLQGNAAQNGLANVTTRRAAVGEHPARVQYPSPSLIHEANYGDLGFHNAADIIRTPTDMVALDDVAPPDTRLVKIDVQGFEPQVLRGAQRLLEEIRPAWFIEASADVAESSAVVRLLLAARYDVFWFYSPFVTALPFRGGRPAKAEIGDANFVALPAGGNTPWPLTRVASPEERRPGNAGAYPYLAMYGY